jgi:hypothetical protein
MQKENTIALYTKKGKEKRITRAQYNTLLVLIAFSSGMFYIT